MGLFKKKEVELPFGWYAHNSHIFKPYEDKVVKLAVGLKGMKGADRIKQLEKLIKQYNDFKKFCYKKDAYFRKYFQDQWEHCHNSRNNDFEYITPYIEELNELKGQK